MTETHRRKGRGLIGAGTTILVALAVAFAASLMMASKAANPPPDPYGNAGSEGVDGSTIDWDYWTHVNPDVVAWIEVPGTAISQPVVQASRDDPTYYLTHDV